MSNSPLETNGFTHWLNFISLGFTELYQISEPSGFDAANFVVKQNEERFSRDIIYGNDKINLVFYNTNFELSEIEQLQDTNGRTSFYLDNGLNWILETRNRFGFEGKIEYILKKDDILFTTGSLDLANPDTDGFSYFGCTIIQNSHVADYKRHEETKLNILGTKNVKGEDITPVNTVNFLRKAVSIFKKSSIETLENYQKNIGISAQDGLLYNPAISLTVDDLENTSIPSSKDLYVDGPSTNEEISIAINHFKYFKAKKKTINMLVKVSNITYHAEAGAGIFLNSSLTIRWGNSTSDSQYLQYFKDDVVNIVNENVQLLIPILDAGQSIWIYFSTFNPSINLNSNADITIAKSLLITFEASSLSIDTIVKGVRYIDMMKQSSKFINNLPINAPRFDIGGEFYDQICFNRALIGQNILKPFTTSFKETMSSVQEVCGDYEITSDKIFIGQFQDFYENNEIGVFQIIPSADYKEPWNDRFKINLFSFGYSTYEQDRLTPDTEGDVHTESEWIIPNSMVENKKEVIIDFIRSAFSQQVAADLEISKPNVSDQNDDKVYIVDVVPNTETSNKFSVNLTMNWIEGKLNISNKNSTTESENAVVNWVITGAIKEEQFKITLGTNSGTYIVDSITPVLIVLREITTISPKLNGDYDISIEIPYIGIDYMTRTNQDLIVIGNKNTTSYPNLKYTIKNNMKYWGSLLNTACHFVQDKLIRNSYFKNNPELQTSFEGGSFIAEKADIPISSLNPRLITPKMLDLKVAADFIQITSLLNMLKNSRGFIRCYDVDGRVKKGYIQDLDHTWKTNELSLVLEEKYESELVEVNFSDGILSVSNVVYDLSVNSEWWKVTNEYFAAFDVNNIPICNRTRFDKVSLNGIIYNSEYDLVFALKLLD